MGIENFFISKEASVKEAIKQIDDSGYGIALVVDADQLVGIVTDNDIRHALFLGLKLESKVSDVMNKEPVTLKENYIQDDIKELVRNTTINAKFPFKGSFLVPVVDANKKVLDMIAVSRKGYLGSLTNGKNPARPVKCVLVVGGAGYLGSVLCKKLLHKGYIVKVLDNLMYTEDGLKNLYGDANFTFIKGDITDIDTVVEATRDVDAVIHLAAIVGDPASALNPKKTIEINHFATRMLAEICKYSQINRFIFASSCSVYGAAEEKLNEESLTNPQSLYAEMKLKSEEAILELADDTFSPTVFRMATLFGLSDRMRFDLVVNLFIVQALLERKFTVFGGEQWRPFLHVDDASEAYIKCLEAPIQKVKGQVFNVGSEEFNYRLIDVGETIKTYISSKMEIVKKEVDKRNYLVSFDKIKNILGFHAVTGIVVGCHEIQKANFLDYKASKYSNVDYLKGK